MGKTLLLGTAQWGWTVSRAEAFRLLDRWLAAGFREIDAATNYPINKIPADFRAAEKILHEYARAHGLHGELQIVMKVGSVNNLRTPEINLAPSFLLMLADEYHRLFDENLAGFMIHWDNRQDAAAVRETLDALARIQREHGLRPGLSGVANPEIYAAENQSLGLEFDIELKHNLLQSDLGRYKPFYGGPHRFLAYGLNAGGLKLDGQYSAGSTLLARGGEPEPAADLLAQLRERLPKWNTAFVRPPLMTMNHFGLLYAALNPLLHGMILGVRDADQLTETLDFCRNLEVFDYADVFSELSSF